MLCVSHDGGQRGDRPRNRRRGSHPTHKMGAMDYATDIADWGCSWTDESGSWWRLPASLRIFYKNITSSWHLPIPFPLDQIHVATGSGAGGFFVRCRALQKCHSTIQRRSRPDDRRNE